MNVYLPARPEPLTIATERTGLVVVDMQNAFCKPGGMMDHWGKLDTAMVAQVTMVCRKVLAAARAARLRVCYLRMAYGLETDAALGPESPHYWKEKGLEAERRDPSLAGRFLHTDTWGWEIIEELEPQPGDIIIDKPRFSGFVRTDLDNRLQTAGLTHLLFTGMFTNICVESTLRDAFFRDYFPVLVEDACAQVGPRYAHDATVFNVQQAFGWVISSGDLIKSLG